jgi:hypothetical protein
VSESTVVGGFEGYRAPVPQPSALARALAELQAELPTINRDQTAEVKTKTGDKYSYTYADLAAISAEVLPRLGKHGLSFIAKPTMRGNVFVLAYSLLHESGEREDGDYPLPSNVTPQQLGSAITYGRRYCLCAVTGVATTDDDDDARQVAERQERAAVAREQATTQLASDVAAGRDMVRSAWAVSFGTDGNECAEFYKRWTTGRDLWAADGPELRRYAGYLANLPPAVAGSDPATVPAGDDPSPVGDRGPKLTAAQRTKINAIMTRLYGKDRQARLAALSAIAGRTVESSNDLSRQEASGVINELEESEHPQTSAGVEPVSGTGGAGRKGEPADAVTPPVAGPDAPADPTQEA